jgi:Phage tail lysozyme
VGAAAHSRYWQDSTGQGGKRRIRRAGRHTTPSQVQKVAERASRAAPAVGLVGVLAAAPQVRDLMVSAPAAHAVTTHSAAGQAGAADALAGQIYSDRLQGATARRQQAQKADTYRARHRAAADSGRAGSGSSGIQRLPGAHHRGGQSGGGHSGGGQSGGGRHATYTCSGAGPLLPQHYAKIMHFLTRHGYTGLAAAGIAGNIFQESGGDPESGGGLIGWTPLPAGLVSGNPQADLWAQLAAVLTFNQGWAQYLPELNAASTAPAAADIYMVHFERPGLPAAARREAAATAVAAACGQ